MANGLIVGICPRVFREIFPHLVVIAAFAGVALGAQQTQAYFGSNVGEGASIPQRTLLSEPCTSDDDVGFGITRAPQDLPRSSSAAKDHDDAD